MSPDQYEKVRSLEEYIARVHLINEVEWKLGRATVHVWLRGQANLSWTLLPGLYRPEADPEWERELSRDFRLSAGQYLSHLPRHDLEWMFVMQHHGLPTRLLDWTESHLTALYFAVEDSYGDHDACVWVLNPWKLNEATLGASSIPTASDRVFEKYSLGDPTTLKRFVDAEMPAAIRPERATSRILAQRGVFTVHGWNENALDVAAAKIGPDLVRRIIISGESKYTILRQLYLAGVSRVVLFPGLDGLCNELRFRYSRRYFERGAADGA